jgi:hypothetical protein
MKRSFYLLLTGVALVAVAGSVDGRGGGFSRGGSYGGAGDRGSYSGSYDRGGGSGFSSFSASNREGGSYSGERSASSYSNSSGRGASGSYDHTWDTAAGGSISTSGSRSASEGPWGGKTASSSRDTTVTTAGGKTYSTSSDRAAAQGPGGTTVAGRSGSATGAYGGSASWNSAFAGNKYTGNMAHYSSMSATTAHGTSYWSNSYTATHGNVCRTNFGYYNCFNSTWYTAHPGCWAAAGWAAGAAWSAASYGSVASYCGMSASAAPDYDYGGTVVVTDSAVTIDGQDAGTPQQFAEQATSIAEKGQAAMAPPEAEWKPLGVYALVQGSETSSNNIFQLAVNKDGIIRGNYYDGLMDTTTDVFGSIDTKTQRAAWTIGKKKDRVFEAGVYNLTQDQCPCLIHLGSEKTVQMLLVRVQQPQSPPPGANP